MKDVLKRTGSSSVAVEESVGNTTYMTGRVETNQNGSKGDYNVYPCTAVCQRNMTPINEDYSQVRSYVQGIELVALHGDLNKSLQAFVAQSYSGCSSRSTFLY